MNEYKELVEVGIRVFDSLFVSLRLNPAIRTEIEPIFYDCIYKVYLKGKSVENVSAYLRVMLRREIFRYLKSCKVQESKNFLLYYNAL